MAYIFHLLFCHARAVALAWFFVSASLFSQNLVSNGDFEQNNLVQPICRIHRSLSFGTCINWHDSTQSFTYYEYKYGMIKSVYGALYPPPTFISGNYMMTKFTGSSYTKPSTEPSYTKLKSPVKKNIKYTLSYWKKATMWIATYLTFSTTPNCPDDSFGVHLYVGSTRTKVLSGGPYPTPSTKRDAVFLSNRPYPFSTLLRDTVDYSKIKPQYRMSDTIYRDYEWHLIKREIIPDSDYTYLNLFAPADSLIGDIPIEGIDTNRFDLSPHYCIDKIVLTESNRYIQIDGKNLLCKGDTGTLYAIGTPPYRWFKNDTLGLPVSTDSVLKTIPKNNEVYYLKNTLGDIDSFTYTIVDNVNIKILQEDTIICPGDTFTIVPLAANGQTCIWNDGYKGWVKKITQSGMYIAENRLGSCSARDTINIFLDDQTYLLDSTICDKDSFVLKLSKNYGRYIVLDNNKKPLTFPNDTIFVFKKSDSNEYYIKYDNPCNSYYYKYKPYFSHTIITNHKADTSFYCNDSIIVNIFSTYAASYFWRHDSSTVPMVSLKKEGQYVYSISNRCSTINDSFNIVKIPCKDTTKKDTFIDINSFSPNEDGINDFFELVYRTDVIVLSANIYNRFGEKLYEVLHSNNIKWDGKYKDAEQPVGAYLLTVSYLDQNNQIQVKSKTINLIR